MTVGRGFRGEPPRLPFPAVEVERGGLLTYHGPGQLVGYPIVKLEGKRRDIHRFLDDVEGLLVDALSRLGFEATGRGGDGLRGVWVRECKVASIGIAIRRWVTYHGFALNITTDLDAFSHFAPCGLSSDVMTSLTRLDPHVNRADVEAQIVRAFGERFEVRFLD